MTPPSDGDPMTYPGNGSGGWSLPDSSGPSTSEMPPVGQYPPPYPPPSGKPRKSRRIWLVLFLVIVLIAALAVGGFFAFRALTGASSADSFPALYVDPADVTSGGGTGGTFTPEAIDNIQQQPFTGDSGDASDYRLPTEGSYSGSFHQEDLSGRTADKDYQINMSFSPSGSTIEFPSLGCSGTLTLQGFQGDTAVYEEVITSGRRNCVDVGQWWFETFDENNIGAWYSSPDDRWRVTGVLNP